METDEWLAEHKGRYQKTVGYIWECGDDECGCTEATVVSYYENKTDPRWRVPINEWTGEFYTDHESGADAELAAYRRALRESDPEREVAIEWQKGVDYAAVPA